MASKQKALTDLSDDDLMTEWGKAGEELAKARARVEEFAAEHDARVTYDNMQARLGQLNEKERAALLQYAEAQGIESEEAVHNG